MLSSTLIFGVGMHMLQRNFACDGKDNISAQKSLAYETAKLRVGGGRSFFIVEQKYN